MAKKATTATKKASLNFAMIDREALALASSAQQAITLLAQAERALDEVKKRYKDYSKSDREDYTKDEREDLKPAKTRAYPLANAFITRYIGLEDLTNGEVYNFNMVSFLTNIGVLIDAGEDIEEDKKIARKIAVYRDAVVNRVKTSKNGRNRGDELFSWGKKTEIKNDIVDLFAAIVYGMLESGAIEYCGGGLAVKNFEA